jgi:hypothetical protein
MFSLVSRKFLAMRNITLYSVYSSWPIDYWLGYVQRLTRLVSLIKGMGYHADYLLLNQLQLYCLSLVKTPQPILDVSVLPARTGICIFLLANRLLARTCAEIDEVSLSYKGDGMPC